MHSGGFYGIIICSMGYVRGVTIMTDKYEILRKYYGYTSFREGQGEIIDNILSGRDVLAVMPTGAGKSVCYQIPAMMLPGITLVISPLISLMKDQVSALNQNGIRAAYLNSSLTPRQYGLALGNIRAGVYKIIYIAPERLMTDGFLELVSALDISLVAVDEAHCVSQWGHDFRPSYTDIADFVEGLSHRPVVAAFTATATAQVKEDISELLKLDDPYELTTGFDRPNLYFGVTDTEARLDYIRSYLDENPDKSGIIYAMTRKNVEKVYSALDAAGYNVTYYHAGLSDAERANNQEAFIRDVKPVMVATNAFGMGIDKPDVQFIIHYNIPMSMEAYYQEAGRAGRDGSEADCILLYNAADIHTAKFLIENSTDDEGLDGEELEKAKKRRHEKLSQMISYANTTECLRSFILRYFGETARAEKCEKCSSCREVASTYDVTEIVRAVYTAIDVTGERYGAVFITDYLRGVDNGRMAALGFTHDRSFGMLSSISGEIIRDVISRMVESGLLERSNGQYPTLSITRELDKFLALGKSLTLKIKREKSPKSRHHRKSETVLDASVDRALYEKLRAFRRETAERKGVPAYVIFTDMTLKNLAAKKPTNIFELLNVSGIGADKAEKYGTAIIGIVKSMK